MFSAEFSPDGSRVVTAGSDNTAKVWDVESGDLLFTLVGHDAGLTTARFSANGTRILTIADDLSARVWDGGTGQELSVITGHTQRIRGGDISPDGNTNSDGSLGLNCPNMGCCFR